MEVNRDAGLFTVGFDLWKWFGGVGQWTCCGVDGFGYAPQGSWPCPRAVNDIRPKARQGSDSG